MMFLLSAGGIPTWMPAQDAQLPQHQEPTDCKIKSQNEPTIPIQLLSAHVHCTLKTSSRTVFLTWQSPIFTFDFSFEAQFVGNERVSIGGDTFVAQKVMRIQLHTFLDTMFCEGRQTKPPRLSQNFIGHPGRKWIELLYLSLPLAVEGQGSTGKGSKETSL